MTSKPTESGAQSGQGRADTLRGYTITISAAELDEKVREKLAAAQPEVTMKGFRKGKVPMALLRKQFGSVFIPPESDEETSKVDIDPVSMARIAELFDIVKEVDNASIQVGGQLFLKKLTEDGSSSFEVIELSPSAIEYLSENPEILSAPSTVTEKLQSQGQRSNIEVAQHIALDFADYHRDDDESLTITFSSHSELSETDTSLIALESSSDTSVFQGFLHFRYDNTTEVSSHGYEDHSYLVSFSGELHGESSEVTYSYYLGTEDAGTWFSLDDLVERETLNTPTEIEDRSGQEHQILDAIVAAEIDGTAAYVDSVNEKLETALAALRERANA